MRGRRHHATDDGWHHFGGYMKAKVRKLSYQFDENSKSLNQVSTIFKGVSIFVDGYTIPTRDELKVIISQHGGKFNYYSSSSTTHIIASNLPHVKKKRLKLHDVVVKPEWITDSVNQGKLLPIHPYLILSDSEQNQAILNKYFHKEPADVKYVNTEVTSENVKRNIPTTSNSSFLSEFYSHSRLHFLSTWKMELTDYVRHLSSSSKILSGRKDLLIEASNNPSNCCLRTGEKFIVHIDMDCFFVSVGLLTRSHLKDLPVAVTHHQSNTPSVNARRPNTDVDYERNYYQKQSSKATVSALSDQASTRRKKNFDFVHSYSEIASCNYKAREAGLKNGMMYGKAKELCPNLVAIPYDFDAYHQISQTVYEVLASYTKEIEAVSCDEALLDITELVSTSQLSPAKIVEHIRTRVLWKTGCNASAGIGPNIILAKMATKIGKPNGQYQVFSDQVSTFVQNIPVKNLPGVGRATAQRLEELKVQTCKDLQLISLDVLKKEFGAKTGERLHNYSMGVDTRKINSCKERKSVSADVNYGIRLSSEAELKTFINNLSEEVSNRLNRAKVRGKKLTLKVMVRKADAPIDSVKYGGHGVCDNLTRSKALDSFTDSSEVISTETFRLIKPMQILISDLRGVGIQITQLNSVNISPKSVSTLTQFVKSRHSSPAPTEAIDLTSDSFDVQPQEIFSHMKPPETNETAAITTLKSPERAISSSFLAALPEDIRKEVQQDLKAQQKMLDAKRVLDRPKPTYVTRSSTPISKPIKNFKLKKSPTKRKRVLASKKVVSSPVKLITDMFPVISKPVSRDDLIPIDDQNTKDTSSNNENIPDQLQKKTCLPSLGGYTTIVGSRKAIRQWTNTFSFCYPEKEDVDEVNRYLSELVKVSHDLEGSCLILHTLRRSLLNLFENLFALDTQINLNSKVKFLKNLYNELANNLAEVVKEVYNGVSLDIKYLS